MGIVKIGDTVAFELFGRYTEITVDISTIEIAADLVLNGNAEIMYPARHRA